MGKSPGGTARNPRLAGLKAQSANASTDYDFVNDNVDAAATA